MPGKPKSQSEERQVFMKILNVHVKKMGLGTVDECRDILAQDMGHSNWKVMRVRIFRSGYEVFSEIRDKFFLTYRGKPFIKESP